MIYEYGCDPCDRTWDVMRRVADRDAPSSCPQCKREGTRRVTSCGIIFMEAYFPSNDFKEGAFWRQDGRAMSFHEHEFLDREASDDAAAAPDTCVNVAKAKAEATANA